jgi:poly(beta-D-mannuronate) lyase
MTHTAISRRGIICAGLSALTAAATGQGRHALVSPWDRQPVTPTSAPYDCPNVAPLAADCHADAFYSDPRSSIVDQARLKAYHEAMEPVYANTGAVVTAADAYRKTGSLAAARCAVHLLEADAASRGLAGIMYLRQGKYVRNWISGGDAIAFLKVRGSGVASGAQTAAIREWLRYLAQRTCAFFDDVITRIAGDGRNNHVYWGALSVGAIAIVADDRKLWDWAMGRYDFGMQQILPDGTLELEMARGQRAVHYHLFATCPLVILAELGEANGIAMWSQRDFALKRLCERAASGLADPSYFEKKSGVAQEPTPNGVAGDEISWAVPYLRRFPNQAIAAQLRKAPSIGGIYTGGLPPD